MESIFLGEKRIRNTFQAERKTWAKLQRPKWILDMCEEQQLANFCVTVSYSLKVYSRTTLGPKYE